MFKYKVLKDNAEIKANERDLKGSWSTADIVNAYMELSFNNPDTIGTFDTKVKAEKFFDKEKRNCNTKVVKGNIWNFIEADVLILAKTEYDEDGEFIQNEYFEVFAFPLEGKDKLFIEGRRSGYTPDSCGETMTVRELIDFLERQIDECYFTDDMEIYLSNDNGYTYGNITEDSFTINGEENLGW